MEMVREVGAMAARVERKEVAAEAVEVAMEAREAVRVAGATEVASEEAMTVVVKAREDSWKARAVGAGVMGKAVEAWIGGNKVAREAKTRVATATEVAVKAEATEAAETMEAAETVGAVKAAETVEAARVVETAGAMVAAATAGCGRRRRMCKAVARAAVRVAGWAPAVTEAAGGGGK